MGQSLTVPHPTVRLLRGKSSTPFFRVSKSEATAIGHPHHPVAILACGYSSSSLA